jgi:RimJ/RimL family protein N-acetyltransferase
VKELKGENCRLVPFREEFISDRYVAWLNDPDVNRYLEVRQSPQTLESVRSYVRSFQGNNQKLLWGVFSGDDLIGTTSLINISSFHGSADVGIMIGAKASWGSGIGGEVIGLVAEFAFSDLKLRRLAAGSYSVNHGMNTVFQRLGFMQEGIRRKACAVGPGEFADVYCWGLLAEEWEASRRGR